MLVASLSHSISGQTAQEKRQMRIIENEISRLESDLKHLKKKFEKDKKIEIYHLRRELRELDISYRRNGGDQSQDWFEDTKDSLQFRIGFVESITSNLDIEFKLEELNEMRKKREAMIEEWTRPERNVPREMSWTTKRRRQRSNTIRREELTLSKIEENINQTINPSGKEGGYKIILHNEYSLNTTFILKGLDGGQRLAVSLPPKTKSRHYVLPDTYIVECWVAGRRQNQVYELTVDGQVHHHDEEPCFGFIHKARY